MKHLKQILNFSIFAIILFSMSYSQHGHGFTGARADSLEIVNLSGVVIVEETDTSNYHGINMVHDRYYLDTDFDSVADYQLNFGPYWYEPDSSSAKRPLNGDNITVKAGKMTSSYHSTEILFVYEINGEFWRDPHFANWNNLGRRDNYRRHMMNGHRGGYGFGWDHDSISTEELSGVVMIDTTFYMDHYYLDTDSDSQPNYMLNFGPFWYEPESGAVRPTDGQSIVVFGGVLENSSNFAMMIVYELDGKIWRDSSSIGNHFGGGWLRGSMTESVSFHSPFDHQDMMTFDPGWRGSGMGGHGGMNQDSLFCQILEVMPQNISNYSSHGIFAGYEIHMYNQDGTNAMLSNDMMSGRKMRSNNKVRYQFHYTESQLSYWNVDEQNISAMYWDEDSETWNDLNASIDTDNNLVSVESENIGNLVILKAETNITGFETWENEVPTEFELSQNYPNPFNPATKIKLQIPENDFVKMSVFNILGEEVDILLNESLVAGTYVINFDASELPSGIYIYTVKYKNSLISKKMSLLK